MIRTDQPVNREGRFRKYREINPDLEADPDNKPTAEITDMIETIHLKTA